MNRRLNSRFHPNLVELERRDTPAWWSITAPTPAEGNVGSTVATHTGALTFSPDYEVVNGTVTVFGDTATEAIVKALVGSIGVTINGQTTDYAFGAATVGSTVADNKPYLTVITGNSVALSFEDMAGQPGCDYDYNDRSWSGVTVAGREAPVIATFDTVIGVAGLKDHPDIVGLHHQVTQFNDTEYRWEETFTNIATPHNYSPAYGFYDKGVVKMELGVRDIGYVLRTEAPAGWSASLDPMSLDAYLQPVVRFEGPPLMPGQAVTFAHYTPAFPVSQAACFVAGPNGSPNTDGGACLAPGPLPTVSVAVSNSLVPVNANNDNWKQVEGKPVDTDRWLSANLKFIPKIRDFNAVNLWQDDPQLVPLTVTVTGGYAGTLEVKKANGNGLGKLAFWEDTKKAKAFTTKAIVAGTNPTTVTLYVEGQHESSAKDDSAITATFTLGSDVKIKATDSKAVTVSPVINSFTASIPTPSVSFVNQNPANGMNGVQAYKPATPGVAGAPGIEFIGKLTNGPLPIKFVHNVRNLRNGINQNVPLAGAVFVAGSGLPNQSLSPIAGSGLTYPSLDGANPDDPTAQPPGTFASEQNPPNDITVKLQDSPGTSGPNPLVRSKLDKIDYAMSFKLFMTVQYSDMSIYPIAYWEWYANFYATTNVLGSGVTVIDPASKVATVGGWVKSNDDPLKTVGPVWNGNVGWQ